MNRIINFRPAFDKRNPDPKKDYGIRGVHVVFILKGELGATQFIIYTNWHLPHVTQQILNRPVIDEYDRRRFLPLPADVGYHSPKPIYDGQTTCTETCEYLDGKSCYYDGSALQADDVFNIMLEKGSDGVWEELESRYKEIFGELR